jgi:hypothetical protein
MRVHVKAPFRFYDGLTLLSWKLVCYSRPLENIFRSFKWGYFL